MAGLLDPKSRVMDTILTPEGRRRLHEGGLGVKYVTISDAGFSYDSDEDGRFVSGSITTNIESFSTINDVIFPYTDSSNKLLEYRGNETSLTPGGMTMLSGSVASSSGSISIISQISYDSFINQMIASSVDATKNDSGLDTNQNNLEFTISEGRPFDGEPQKSFINDADSLFADKRFANISNFKYLPPTQKYSKGAEGISLGTYQRFNAYNDITNSSFIDDLTSLECKVVELSKNTEYSDLVLQLFESSNDLIKKLDVIKWGRIGISQEGSSSDLYFIGKIYFDEFDVPTFVNIFTLVIE